jgi:hypothetical protein
MTIATGETRPITRWFDGGWFTCPWCGSANPPEAVSNCQNPACWASKYAKADDVRAEQERRARVQRETEERAAAERAAAEMAKASRETADRRWLDLVAKAKEQGACLVCLRKTRWRPEPRFVVHRRADFHEAVTR